VYRKRLEIAGYEVVTARDGEEALSKTRAARPDLIVLDIMLPKMNGYEICTRLKQTSATKRIPIVMFTAKDRPQEHVAGLMVGADAYLSKTCEAETLLEQIERLLAGRAKEGEQAARGAS
jgi:DNA-binding response OmpR family regulator